MFIVCGLVLCNGTWGSEAEYSDPSQADLVPLLMLEDIEALLVQSAGVEKHRVNELELVLGPMFAGLPKNNRGKLEWPAVRQLAHRHFVGESGWHIRGLEPHRNSTPTDLWIRGRVFGDAFPAHIAPILQRKLGSGCGLREVAAVVAALERLILDTGVGSAKELKRAYRLSGLSPTSSLTLEQVETVVESVMISFILGSKAQTTFRHRAQRQMISKVYPGWGKTQEFVRGVLRDFMAGSSGLSFTGVRQAVDVVGLRYGRFQEQDCQDMKTILMDMDPESTGRVPLDSFYAKGRTGAWQFSESREYLRLLGVVEGAEPHSKVLISNYLSSENNCLAKSRHHNVCCLHECEGLLRKIENHIRSPTASPSDILSLVANLSSSTVPAPRGLSVVLIEALHQVAGFHNGRVPLHGRLFSEWMHYAFPHECPYPHLTGTVVELTLSEFQQQSHGVSAVLRRSARNFDFLQNKPTETGSNSVEGVPFSAWTLQEELLAGPVDNAPGDIMLFSILSALVETVLDSWQWYVALAAAFGTAYTLWFAIRRRKSSHEACQLLLDS